MTLYQTRESYLSVKQSVLRIIFCSSALSSGSRCSSARQALGRARDTMSASSTARAQHMDNLSDLTYVVYSLPDRRRGFPSIPSPGDDDIRDYLRLRGLPRSRCGVECPKARHRQI